MALCMWAPPGRNKKHALVLACYFFLAVSKLKESESACFDTLLLAMCALSLKHNLYQAQMSI